MIELLAKKLIPDYQETDKTSVRLSYGVLCGGVGIFFNILLFVAKIFAGIVSGSVAIVADALNNLSDAGSSVIMMVGFKMSGQKPDPEHPFGHGRIEYITGLVVSFIIILMGFELVKSSFAKIMNPGELICTTPTIIILVASVAVKLYMYSYNKRISSKLSSAAMKATAMDSFTDSIATTAVLLATLISQYTGLKLDGYMGLLVSLFILYTGIESAKDVIDPLLGSKPDPEFVNTIEKFVTSFDEVIGIHDLVVHDYGPGRMMISLHAEIPANSDILEAHDTIDNIEKKLFETLGAHATIHMDPVVVDDVRNNRMKRLTELIVKSVDESLKIHDFRMVVGPSHTNLIFDVLLPYEVKMTEEETREQIEAKVRDLPGNHFAVIGIDRPFC